MDRISLKKIWSTVLSSLAVSLFFAAQWSPFLVAIAAGRCGNYSNWSNIMSMHYGILTAFNPIFSWAGVLASNWTFLRFFVEMLLIASSTFGSSKIFVWKAQVQASTNIQISKAQADLQRGSIHLRLLRVMLFFFRGRSITITER